MYVLHSIPRRCTYNLPAYAWRASLRVAELGGWKPTGTVEPAYFSLVRPTIPPEMFDREFIPWCGSYIFHDRQTVTAADAANMAIGIVAMLDDVPNEDIEPRGNLFELLSGRRKRGLRNLVAFLRLGAFQIG